MHALNRKFGALLSIWVVVIVMSCRHEVTPEPNASQASEQKEQSIADPKSAAGRVGNEMLWWWLWDVTTGLGSSPYGTVASGTTLSVVYNNQAGPSVPGLGTRTLITYVIVNSQSCDLTSISAIRNGSSVSQTTLPGTGQTAFRAEIPYDSYNTGFTDNWVITVTPSNAWADLDVFAGTTGYPTDVFNYNGFPVANNQLHLAKVGGQCGSGRTWSITEPHSSVNRLTNYIYTVAADAACAKDNTVVVNIKNTGMAPFKVKYFNGSLVNITLNSWGGEQDFTLPLITGCTATTPSVTYTVQYDQISVGSTIVNSLKSVSSGHSIGSSKTQFGPF